MVQAKKFGTFSGVFTPSILTILGVIMYLRLPWIVGQAGLWNTIAIVIVAHLISVTTGLSVSSIATDKKVKAGGNYYIISRSLGLPIGGMLGLALFVGLSFSVSLYLIGFSESLLAAIGQEITPNTIRLAGTIALLVLSTITFISTSLAIKTQYFVLAAIAISLASVLLGNHELAPAQPHFTPLNDAVPWMVLFGIFFPAVTGFEAGVSMSGDLKDPKKSIPGGTITAIVVGLAAYLGLPFFFAYTVDPNALANDTNVLLKIALVPVLVIVGILSATFSSALGSILGAPRILQATSVDRITPKFFSKGHGKENEPRNALLLTFLIAESGILIGELNVIARVVSMFFITTYGFLNLSCALESWASTDFRPDFKIPRSISILGALACFIVMIQLDFLAMIGATVVMGGIFLYLKRRELTLESGDTWEGVWSSVVRSGLHRLTRGIMHQRNWRPNLILFSGGAAARPHLVELGTWLIHKRGVLSDFELIENPNLKSLQPRAKQAIPNSSNLTPGIFTRRMEVRNIYEGMENISQIYGFSGMDPNTVMMGWARNTRDPEKFLHLLTTLNDLDYNVLLLDYDDERGYGEKKQIDVWWRGRGNNISLALALIRFINSTDEWDDARIRVLIVTEDNSLTVTIQKNMNLVLEDYRIDAEVKVIQNGIERRHFKEIVKAESQDADLTLLGIPPLNINQAARFVKDLNDIADELGSILLICASSYFQEVHVGVEEESLPHRQAAATPTAEIELPALNLPVDERIAFGLSSLDTKLGEVLKEYEANLLQRFSVISSGLLESMNQLIHRIFSNLEKNLTGEESSKNRKVINRSHSDFLFQSQQILTDLQQKQLEKQRSILEEGNTWLETEIDAIINNTPETLSMLYDSAEFQPDASDSLSLKFFKFRKRLRAKLSRKPISQSVHFRELLKYYLLSRAWEVWYGELEKTGSNSYQTILDIQKLLDSMRDSLLRIEKQWMQDNLNREFIAAEEQSAKTKILQLENNSRKVISDFYQTQRLNTRNIVNTMADDLRKIDLNHRIKRQYRLPKTAAGLRAQILEAPEVWTKNQHTCINIVLLDIILMSLQNRIRVIVQRVRQDINLNIESNLLRPLEQLSANLHTWVESPILLSEQAGEISKISPDEEFQFEEEKIVQEFFEELREATDELPETIDTFSEETYNQITTKPFEESTLFTISLQRLVEYLIEENFIDPLREYLETLPRQFQRGQTAARDVIRLVSFQLESPGQLEAAEAVQADLESVLKDSEKRVREECQRIEEIHKNLNATTEQLLNQTFEQMNTYAVTRTAENLRHYIRSQEGQKVLSKFDVARDTAIAFLKDKLVRLWYQRSESLLVARKLQSVDEYQKNTAYQLLNLRDAISPKPEVLSALPFYYRQLFSGEPNIHPNFWIGREKEIALAEKTLERFQKGYSGGLLITGEENSGKTSLCYYIANRHFSREQIFSVYTPPGGSIDPADFRNAVKKALQMNELYLHGKLSQIFNALPQNCAMIFNDLELWWERGENGSQVLDSIMELINNYSHKCFFMVNINLHSLQLIDRMYNIEGNFLGAIECQPFDAEELKDVILLRHRSTGLKMELNGISEDDLSEWRLAKLFNGLFDFSRGNVGVALQSWISQIRKIHQGQLTIRELQKPDTESLEHLETGWIILLNQLLLHKRLTRQRLARIMADEEKNLQALINPLKRCGLILENNGGLLRIDPYLYPLVREKFREREMI
jgi:amino acid transporter/GTPase SAR1 family protein